MFIRPDLGLDGTLTLEAYSYREEELESVSRILIRVYSTAQGLDFIGPLERQGRRSHLEELRNSIKIGLADPVFERTYDKDKRRGRTYYLLRELVHVMEWELKIRFWRHREGGTYTTFLLERPEEDRWSNRGEVNLGPPPYRCKEIDLAGDGNGCENLSAKDIDEATVKCALIAHNNGWFGGVAAEGRCEAG